MFRLRRPDAKWLAQLRENCRDLPFNYADVGCANGPAPPGYVLDNYRLRLGDGGDVFDQAIDAMRAWRMLYLGWVEPCWPDAPIKEGALVGTIARVLGLWAVNVCRVVSVVEEESRFGLAYGTLPGHVEQGEERFLVERLADGSVWFEVQAASRPGQWLTRLGYPMVRRMQRRFGRDSLRAMAEAVSVECSTEVQRV